MLSGRLKPALRRLNPDIPEEAIEGAVEEIFRDRTALSLAEANREIDKLLKQGVKIREGIRQKTPRLQAEDPAATFCLLPLDQEAIGK